MKIPFCARLSPFPRGGASGDVDNQGSVGVDVSFSSFLCAREKDRVSRAEALLKVSRCHLCRNRSRRLKCHRG